LLSRRQYLAEAQEVVMATDKVVGCFAMHREHEPGPCAQCSVYHAHAAGNVAIQRARRVLWCGDTRLKHRCT
jgi:hypothetical protein